MDNITKQEIIKEIRRTAHENGGAPLGKGRFEKETGIKPYDWGKYWPKFGDVLVEAGFKPNTLQGSYDAEFIIQKYVELIKELGHFPTTGELTVRSNSDSEFPSKNSMRKLGDVQTTATKILEFAKTKGYDDIVKICEKIIETRKITKKTDFSNANVNTGEVYLFNSGKYYKIGKSNNTVRRGKELRIQLPEKCTLIHSIITDDPSGVESYWHKRFESKRMQGEWFDLNSSEIKAFKRWRKIF